MHRFALSIAPFFLATSLMTPLSGAVIGEDDRRPPGADDVALSNALGLVVCGREQDGRRLRAMGTGTVVGSSSTVLTSAHMFRESLARPERSADFNVTRDCVFRQYDSTGQVRVEASFAHSEMGAFLHNAGAPNQDWAVLATTQPLPAPTTALPFSDSAGEIESLAGMPIRMLAYHADLRRERRGPLTPLLSEGKLMDIDYAGFARLGHTADSGRMSSGAAIVHRTGDGRDIVVGINRSSANFGEFNLAVPLSPELRQVLRSFAFGQVPARGQLLAAGP